MLTALLPMCPTPRVNQILCCTSESFDADVIVVGGGASGLFSAIAAARAHATVLVLESGSSPLRKVKISGGGRCNVMHDQSTWDARDGRTLLQQRYPRGAAELTGSLTKRFSPLETAAWFEAEGVELKREADGRVFPTTDDSSTVIEALLGAADRAGVELRLSTKVVGIDRLGRSIASGDEHDGAASADHGFAVRIAERAGVARTEATVRARALILATGSTSHELAENLGHEISPLIPSLFSFRLRPGGMLDASLAGVSVADAELTLVPQPPPPPPPAPPSADSSSAARGSADNISGEGVSSAAAVARPNTGGGKSSGKAGRGRAKGKKGGGGGASISARGPMLVTHRGVSGPAALRLSAFAAKELAGCNYRGTLELNLAPELTRAQVTEQLVACRARMPMKAVGNVNPFNLPKRLWAAVVTGGSSGSGGNGGRGGDAHGSKGGRGGGAAVDSAHSVDPATQWAQLSKQDMRALEERTCRAPLAFSGKDSNKDEFVTAGGVCWSAIDTKRMESKHVPGLFFAGELLDVDGVTGGHNFQSCWTTGYVAGNAAADLGRCRSA